MAVAIYGVGGGRNLIRDGVPHVCATVAAANDAEFVDDVGRHFSVSFRRPGRRRRISEGAGSPAEVAAVRHVLRHVGERFDLLSYQYTVYLNEDPVGSGDAGDVHHVVRNPTKRLKKVLEEVAAVQNKQSFIVIFNKGAGDRSNDVTRKIIRKVKDAVPESKGEKVEALDGDGRPRDGDDGHEARFAEASPKFGDVVGANENPTLAGRRPM